MTKSTIITALLALVALTGWAQRLRVGELSSGMDTNIRTLADTYWRNEATGDWLIGFASQHVIYSNKVYDIANQTEKKDVYTLTLSDGTVIKVDKLKKGKRSITIGHESPIACSPITTAALPDYPTKDLRQDFVDNGYRVDHGVGSSDHNVEYLGKVEKYGITSGWVFNKHDGQWYKYTKGDKNTQENYKTTHNK